METNTPIPHPIPKSCESCALDCRDRKYITPKKNPIDVLFVLDSPNFYSVMNKMFIPQDDKDSSAVEYLYASTIDAYRKELLRKFKDVPFDFTHDYTYTVSCHIDPEDPSFPKEYRTAKGTPSALAIQKCHGVLFSTIRRLDPKIIIPVGDSAAKSLYIIFKKFDHVVARTNQVRILGKEYTVIPLPKAEKIADIDNYFNVSQFAIQRALDEIFYQKYNVVHNIDVSKYVFPRTVEEVRDLVRNVIIPRTTGENRGFLGVDIETNSRYAYHEESRMIMISFSWGDGESAAIWCDTRHECSYSFSDVREYIQEVLESDSRKVFHNNQFDTKFLMYAYGFKIRNNAWDTMLVEHILDENMKGFYNLEFMAGRYFPRFENYKKLALKKISTKDSLIHETGDKGTGTNNETESDNEFDDDIKKEVEEEDKGITFADLAKAQGYNNEEYRREIVEYENEVLRYENNKIQHKVALARYEQDMQRWKAEQERHVLIKLSAYPKEEREQLKELKEKAKKSRPVRPKLVSIPRPKKPDLKKYSGEDTKVNFEDYDPRDLEVYCAMDSDITRQIAYRQLERIQEDDPKMIKIISLQHAPASRALSHMEYLGANTNQEYLTEIEAELKEDYERLGHELQVITEREDFKQNSSQQIAQVIHSKFGVPINPEWMTASGSPSTDKATLLKHAMAIFKEKGVVFDPEFKHDFVLSVGKRLNNPVLIFIGTLLTFRDVGKAYKTTVGNFRRFTQYDGKLRTYYMQSGTTTGRLASNSPNLQNIASFGGGKNLKKFIIPDDPTHVLCNVDIKAAEIRCLLAYAPEPSLIKAIREGMDFHCTTASEVWLSRYPKYKTPEEFYQALVDAHNAPEDSVTEEQIDLQKRRKATKGVNFGLIYGITKFGLARDLKCSEQEAQGTIDTYFARYKRIKKYMDETLAMLSQRKEVQSLTGRKRRFPRYELNRNKAFRQAINFRIQNIASDLVVRCIGEMHKNIQEELEGRLVLTVHDSVLLSLPKKNIPKINEYLNRMLVEEIHTKYPWLPVAFEYDFEIGMSYGELSRPTEELIQKYLSE